MQKTAKNSQSGHHCTTLSGYIFATKACIDSRKKLVKQQYLPHISLQYGPLVAEIVLLVWGTPANFKGFCVLASLLQQCRSMEVNQTLYDLWPFPVLVHCIYILGLSYPLTEFGTCKIHFASNFCILRYWQRYCTALHQLALATLCGVVQGMELRNFRRAHDRYSAGRPSRWALAHILVLLFFLAYSQPLQIACLPYFHTDDLVLVHI